MLYNSICEDIKNFMKEHDKESTSTIRLLKSNIDLYALNNKITDKSDEVVIEVVSKEVKKLKESIVDFEKGNRSDLVDNANREISLLQKYLPKQLTNDELNKILDEVFDLVKPESVKDMGKIMKEVTPKVKGKADMSLVSSLIKERL